MALKPERGDTQRGRCYGPPRRAVNRERLRVPYIGADGAAMRFRRLAACSFGLQRGGVAHRDVRRSWLRGRWNLQGSFCAYDGWSGRQDDRRIGRGRPDAMGRFAVVLPCGLKQRPVVAQCGERQPRRDVCITVMRSMKSMRTAKQNPSAKGS
ncbi:hypothetical protein [Burkholderia lata]|uniref:hypothetical protein n=1 Tax=Burkholderia lata (strain ATCC 17760 / DSM 23089 / LMG 22485 / NCIMB 9086 / R18194 / 383) TaxID=482957 RepID=UPI001583271B|nr:hypothetical protein [Burkholderia lata]